MTFLLFLYLQVKEIMGDKVRVSRKLVNLAKEGEMWVSTFETPNGIEVCLSVYYAYICILSLSLEGWYNTITVLMLCLRLRTLSSLFKWEQLGTRQYHAFTNSLTHRSLRHPSTLSTVPCHAILWCVHDVIHNDTWRHFIILHCVSTGCSVKVNYHDCSRLCSSQARGRGWWHPARSIFLVRR